MEKLARRTYTVCERDGKRPMEQICATDAWHAMKINENAISSPESSGFFVSGWSPGETVG